MLMEQQQLLLFFLFSEIFIKTWGIIYLTGITRAMVSLTKGLTGLMKTVIPLLSLLIVELKQLRR